MSSTDGATDLLLDNGQAKWNTVKLGMPSPSAVGHKVVLDSIRPDYEPSAPNSLVALRKRPAVANPYAQTFPHIPKSPPRHHCHAPSSGSTSPVKTTVSTDLPPCPRPTTTPSTPSLLPSTNHVTFRELAIVAPKPRKNHTTTLSLPKPTSRASASSFWDHSPMPAAPRFVPGLRSDDLKSSRQLARQRRDLDAVAHRLSKHERCGPTLASTLDDDQFTTDLATITTLAQSYATLGDSATAWKYRGFALRALGDRHMHMFVKNLTLQFYSDAVQDFQRACTQFEALAAWHVQSREGRDVAPHHILADDERLELLHLDATRVVQAFAAHAATTSLKHAYFAVSEAKTSRTGVSNHIRVACEMLSIAYTAFAWLDLDTVHLGFVHSSIDAAQHRANLRAALSHVAMERHAALESEWAKHRMDFNKQAESFLHISKQAQSLRIAPKDNVTVLSTKVAASNVEKRAMAAVVQVMHGTGGNYVVRGHGQHVKETEQVKKMSRKSSRRRVPLSQHATTSNRDVVLSTLLAEKRTKAQKALFDEDLVFASVAAENAAMANAQNAATRELQAWSSTRDECDAMDAECALSLAVELMNDTNKATQKQNVARYVEGVIAAAVRRCVRPAVMTPRGDEIDDDTTTIEDETREHTMAKAFFASDVEAQRAALANEVEACKAMFAKRVADSDEQVRKMCLKLHERAFAEDSIEDLVYESLQDDKVVAISYHRPSTPPQADQSCRQF
ncbi:hypothetical protein H310_08664 [Aphanomyces invadans]|uniref:Uncharacterized protein n=1 Tax=Aphanomyces invadans TaxID=157072 RepID=A0A024TX35_9STRA|nr:hypothetical protein H310_08664 [Aphanomyces invadans]ETV98539.1 hypothetical protein H310_08664 [Aphanomyces invadans]|eukprot:XP_008872736.1 hypothetical protein H310_08664 [Aphanomyces invadans]